MILVMPALLPGFDMKDTERRKSDTSAYEGKKIAIASSGLNSALTAIKFLLYLFTGSAAVLAEAVQGFPEVKKIVSLRARNSGRFVFVEAVLTIALKRLKEAHELADRIEDEIRRRVSSVEKVLVHYEPEKRDCTRQAVPLADLDDAVSEHFSGAPFVAVWDTGPDGAVLSLEILENPFRTVKRGAGIRLAAFLAEKEINILYAKAPFAGKGPEYVLSDAGIDLREPNTKSLAKLMKGH